MDSTDVGRLLSLISHEVRGPLGVMRGYLRLLEQRGPELSEQQQHAVTAALRAGERAAELLAQVSLLARVFRAEQALDFHPTTLADLILAVTSSVELPEDPPVTVEVAPVPTMTLTVDAALLRVALTPLVSALARAQPSQATLRITARTQHRHDTAGIVIDIEIANLTEAMDVAGVSENPLDLTRGGLGLDLPLAAALIAAHGGDVMERRRGNRTVAVVVWLPRAP